MINITPLIYALSLIIASCVVYAVLWLMVQAWRLFVAWCEEMTG